MGKQWHNMVYQIGMYNPISACKIFLLHGLCALLTNLKSTLVMHELPLLPLLYASIILTLLIIHLIILVTVDNSCPLVAFEKIGCFKDNHIVSARPLPEYLTNDRDPKIATFSGQRIDWRNWDVYIPDFACRCALKAKEKNYTFFGMQFYGEKELFSFFIIQVLQINWTQWNLERRKSAFFMQKFFLYLLPFIRKKQWCS